VIITIYGQVERKKAGSEAEGKAAERAGEANHSLHREIAELTARVAISSEAQRGRDSQHAAELAQRDEGLLLLGLEAAHSQEAASTAREESALLQEKVDAMDACQREEVASLEGQLAAAHEIFEAVRFGFESEKHGLLLEAGSHRGRLKGIRHRCAIGVVRRYFDAAAKRVCRNLISQWRVTATVEGWLKVMSKEDILSMSNTVIPPPPCGR